MGYWAATQVKGLIPEMPVVSEADAVHLSGRQYSHNRKWRGYANPTESETMARYQRESVETREAHNIPLWLWVFKPLEGKEVFLKSRMRENCKSGFVRGFIVDSKQRRRL